MNTQKILTTTLALSLIISLCLSSCGGDEPAKTDDNTIVQDSTAIEDTSSYVSDNFYEDPEPTEEDNSSSSYSSGSSDYSYSGGGGTAGPSKSYLKYESYERSGTSPRDYGEAMVWHVIQMVYAEEFKSARSKVLSSDLVEGVYTIELQVTWSDRWVSNYKVKGTLTVNEDGTNPKFEITERNENAESLEFTHEDTKLNIELEQI